MLPVTVRNGLLEIAYLTVLQNCVNRQRPKWGVAPAMPQETQGLCLVQVAVQRLRQWMKHAGTNGYVGAVSIGTAATGGSPDPGLKATS